MTSSVDPKDTNPAEKPSQIYGDSIALGNIEHSGAVAIGRDAQVTINQYTKIIVKADNFEDLPPTPGEPHTKVWPTSLKPIKTSTSAVSTETSSASG